MLFLRVSLTNFSLISYLIPLHYKKQKQLGYSPQCIKLINEKLLKNTVTITGNQGQPTLVRMPCLNFCEQVITRCIGKDSLDELNDGWKSYVLAFNDLALKLSTSYNFETIIAPLDVQISEAIMNFQENASNITQEVFSICGRPPHNDFSAISGTNQKPLASNRLLKRETQLTAHSTLNPKHQRSASHNFRSSQPAQLQKFNMTDYLSLAERFSSALREPTRHHVGPIHLTDDLSSLGLKSPSLIDEIRNYMLSTKSFWSALPNSVCTSNYTLGPKIASSSLAKKPNCFQEHFSIMDFNFDIRYKFEIHQTINQLSDIRTKITSALAGEEIEWALPSLELTPNVGVLSGPRQPPQTTTSTTTSTMAPTSDEEEGIDDFESGSGEEENDTSDLEDNISTEDTMDIDTDSTTDTYLSETSTPISDNAIDITPPPEELGSRNFIVAEPNAQKSSQAPSKLVRCNSFNLLLVTLVSVALQFVTRFSDPQRRY